MKKICIIALSIFTLFIGSCGLRESAGDVVVKNNSDYEATGIVLTYEHSSDGEKTKKVGTLPPNSRKKETLVISSRSWMAYVAPVKIKYWLNGVEYGVRDSQYSEWGIAPGKTVMFVIENGGYEIR